MRNPGKNIDSTGNRKCKDLEIGKSLAGIRCGQRMGRTRGEDVGELEWSRIRRTGGKECLLGGDR